MSSETATFETASGRLATQTVESVDAIQPQLVPVDDRLIPRDSGPGRVTFVRGAARWLDAWFPQQGNRGPKERGGWTGEDGIETQMQQVGVLAPEGRGLRIIRVYRLTPPGGPLEGAVRVVAVGLPAGVELELRWNFIASETEVRGTSAELTVEGSCKEECVADFRQWFAMGEHVAGGAEK